VQQVKAGTVKAIATMGLSRSGVLPDLPTATEQGFDLDCASLSAFAFPKGTPAAIVRRLAEATNKVVETASVRERFEALGVVIEPPERRTIEYFVRNLPRDVEKAVAVVKAGGLSAE
jgi:tripartite-type tricarboxylate transporter receptor subunit TctC